MNKCIVIVFCLLVSLNMKAQQQNKILLVPYDQQMYLSDAEQDLIKYSKTTPTDYRNYFRKTLDLKILAEIKTVMGCHSMLLDTSKSGINDLAMFYRQCAYTYQTPVGSSELKQNGAKKPSIFNKLKKKDEEEKIPTYITTKGDSKYMDAKLTDTAFVSYLKNKNECNTILAINQFEIKTNYSSCLDIANKVYEREIIVHYTLINEAGKTVSGNFLVAYFPSSTIKIAEIAEKTFPVIASKIKSQIEQNLK